MPRLIRSSLSSHRVRTKYGESRRRKRGAGFMDFLGKANDFLKSTKLVSSIGNMGLQFVPPQYQGMAQGLLNGASKLGYGRRSLSSHGVRTKQGGALRVAGRKRMIRRR